jgi:hypothetical protein
LFVTFSHFHPILYTCKARSQQLERSPLKGFILVGSSKSFQVLGSTEWDIGSKTQCSVSRLFKCYTECRYAECTYVECHYAECLDYLHVMLNIVILNIVIMNVIMLSVVAPYISQIVFYFLLLILPVNITNITYCDLLSNKQS